MHIQRTGAGDKPHPDLPRDGGGSGESGGQREENDFDRGASRKAIPLPPEGLEDGDRIPRIQGKGPREDSARGLLGGQ
jgi:hypothetical protein